MRSPWKLLVQLTSGRRQEDPQQRSSENESGRQPIESEAQQSPVIPPNVPEVFPSNRLESDVDGAQAVPLPVAVDTHQPPAHDEIPQSGGADTTIVPRRRTNIKSSGATRIKRPAPVKEDRVQLVARGAVATELKQSGQPSSATDPFFEETASLDDEIRQLRRQLAQKLNLQNVQLRKMLERFDRL